jgi:hypothetical protein
MDLYLRKVIHPQARDNYRVVLKDYIPEVEIGSIGIQHGIGGTEYWTLAIDNEIIMREAESQGRGKDRSSGMGEIQRRSRSADRVYPGETEAALKSLSRYEAATRADARC